MSESEKRLKANRVIAGNECGWCGAELEFGEDAVVCGACDGVHHEHCWDAELGCSSESCENAPLTALEPEPAAEENELPPGRKRCPHCGRSMNTGAAFCPSCRRAPTRDGVYRGPKRTAPGATASLVFGILGLFICGIIFGILAITKSNEARRAIARNPRYKGEGLAIAGMVLGIIALLAWAGVLFLRFSGEF